MLLQASLEYFIGISLALMSDLLMSLKITCLLPCCLCFLLSLVARIMWRLDKEGSVVSDMQLTTLEELEDHIADMQEDELKEFKVDIHNFLDYWPRSSKQHTIDDISHIFGVVCLMSPSCYCSI